MLFGPATARRALSASVLALAATACVDRRSRPDTRETKPATAPSHSAPALRSSAVPRRDARPPPTLPKELLEAESRVTALPSAATPTGEDPDSAGPIVVDELVDVGPAGPATAHPSGIILVDKREFVHVARRGRMPTVPRPAPAPIASLDLEKALLAPYGRGPAVAGAYAYWVSQGRLVRHRIDGSGDTEVLARDARTGTRVAATVGRSGPALVAYVVTPKDEKVPTAKLWVEGGKTYALTPDGSGASSVALAQQKNAVIALSLDGRTGMTPLHARRIVLKGRDVWLGPDVVAWVGASSQPTTEVIAASRGDDVWALVAIERDVLHFGLAQVHIGVTPRMEVPAEFVPFANGINTSSISSATFCNRSVVVFARPSSAQPGAPQELMLAELTEKGIEPRSVIARSRAFADASLAAVEGGAILCYTADHRTWATTLRCR